MRYALAIGFGLFEIVAPERIIEHGERLAFANPDAGRLRPWTVPIARLEGIAFCWLFGRKAGPPDGVKPALAVVGLVTALLPRTVVETSLELAYENPGDLELKRWVVPAARLLGVLYVVAGLVPTPARALTESDEDSDERA